MLGGWLPSRVRITHNRTQWVMSFVGGLMLGVGIFHMLPHAVGPISLDQALMWLMAGLLSMFFMLRFLHFHQHGPGDPEPRTTLGCEAIVAAAHDQKHAHDSCDHEHGPQNRFTWLGITLGLAVHTMLDGVALAASVESEALAHAGDMGFYGLGTFLAVLLHKPLDAMAITSMMAIGGWSLGWRMAINASFAALVPMGAMIFLASSQALGTDRDLYVSCALAFSAGMFICISLSDLLPELEFHSHDRIKLSTLLLLGVATAYVIGFFESAGHNHSAPNGHDQHHHVEEPPGHGEHETDHPVQR